MREASRLEQARAALVANPEDAVRRAFEVIALHPDDPRAYRILAAGLRRLGRMQEAGAAEADAIRIAANSEPLRAAGEAMRARDVEKAERLLRSCLGQDPDDPQALRMLAEIAALCGYMEDAERLLRRALEITPGFMPLHINFAMFLQDAGRTDEAVAVLDRILAAEPGHRLVLSFKAEILSGTGRIEEALKVLEDIIAIKPGGPSDWTAYADLLKVLGRFDEAVRACRTALSVDPRNGSAWWSLASLAPEKLDDMDIDAMKVGAEGAHDDPDRIPIHLALGRALGARGRFAESFRHYEAANELRGRLIPSDPEMIAETVRKSEAALTSGRLKERAGQGAETNGPIFIVGLPRSGSTLVEQILASHPLVEGLGELFDMDRIVSRLVGWRGKSSDWPDLLPQLGADQLRAMGEAYLASTHTRRQTDRPFFTDKMPSNWMHLGLIHLILPGARIIDVRRHPVACCFSNYTLYFNRVTNLASTLPGIAAFYRNYVRMMAHFDRVLPGRVHRVFYENLVGDLEGEVRKLLDHLGLPFDAACLRYYDTQRPVRTPSARQVRVPIERKGLDHWRHYEPWLQPLKEALGPLLDSYPAVPPL